MDIRAEAKGAMLWLTGISPEGQIWLDRYAVPDVERPGGIYCFARHGLDLASRAVRGGLEVTFSR